MARHHLAHDRPSFLLVLEGLALTMGLLYFGKPFLVPLALAVLITFVLAPIVLILQKVGLGRLSAVLAVVAITFMIVAAIGWGVGVQVQRLAGELPAHQAEIERKIASFRSPEGGPISRLLRMVGEINSRVAGSETPVQVVPGDELSQPALSSNAQEGGRPAPVIIVQSDKPSTIERLTGMVVPILEPLAMAGLVIILVVFMLIRREDLRNRVLGLLGHGHLTGTTRVFMDTAERVSNFLLNQLLVNAGFGVIFGLGLYLIGVPYAFLWAALAAILRFIPYIGTWIALAFPLVLSIAIFPGWTQPILLLALFIVLELITANVIEPLLFGHSTGVAPIALLIAAAFWTWIWGPIGLVLSTPLTVCLVVLGQHIPRFRFLSLLLGDEPALAPHASYYQRLLAKDENEALEVARTFAAQEGLEKTYDEVLLPALLLARRDRKQGGLDAPQEEFIFQATQQILKEIGDDQTVAKASTQDASEAAAPPDSIAKTSPPVLVLGCPAHHEAEELSLQMLAQELESAGCRMEVIPTKALPAEVEAHVEERNPEAVFIAIMPPSGLPQARYLCRRLRKRFRDLPIVVGYWGSSTRSFDRILVQLRSAGATYVATSLQQSKGQILGLIQPALAVPKTVNQPAGAL